MRCWFADSAFFIKHFHDFFVCSCMKPWFLIVGILIFSSCHMDFGNDQSTSQSTDVSSTDADNTQTKEAFDVLLVNVDQLRLRRYGNVKSEMVTTLDENATLYFTGEQTDYHETIGGHTGPWKRVRTLDGSVEGWIFAADHFAETWLTKEDILSYRSQGMEVEVFSNLSTKELADLTGANFDSSPRGSRYTGYYTYPQGDVKKTIDGTVTMRARLFSTSSKEVKFVKCTLEVNDGMPTGSPECEE